MIIKSFFDSITRIRNSSNLKMKFVKIRTSKFILNVLSILYELGFIAGFKIINLKETLVFLRYLHNFSVFRNLLPISKPSKFIFISKKQLNYYNFNKRNFNSFFLISTNKGILTDKQCISLGIGGKLILEIF